MGICTVHLPRTQMGPATVIIGETNQRATVSFSRRKGGDVDSKTTAYWRLQRTQQYTKADHRLTHNLAPLRSPRLPQHMAWLRRVIAISLSSSLLIWAPSFCWPSNVLFRLTLMVLDFGRVINLT